MTDTTNPRYLDKRTAERYMRQGQLDEKVWEKHVKGLPDVAEKAVKVETFRDDLDDPVEDMPE